MYNVESYHLMLSPAIKRSLFFMLYRKRHILQVSQGEVFILTNDQFVDLVKTLERHNHLYGLTIVRCITD